MGERLFVIGQKLYAVFLDILFPVGCIGCGKEGTSLCLSCISGCKLLQENPGKETYALFSYKDPLIRHSIWMLKYKNRPGIVENLGKVLYEKILEEYIDLRDFSNFDNPILMPIPLSEKRLRERGYNQAEKIARVIKFYDNEKLFTLETSVLYRNRNTKRQANIRDRRERLYNLTDCFSVRNKEKISNRNIILLDDVVTTGATLSEARAILKKSGAKRVISFTIAH